MSFVTAKMFKEMKPD
jgi:hypothetical protein